MNIRPAAPTASSSNPGLLWENTVHRIKSVQLCYVINDMQSATNSNSLTWSRQKFKSLMVSKIKPGVLSVSMFSIFLKVEGKHSFNKVI